MYVTAFSPIMVFLAGVVSAMFVFRLKKEMKIEAKELLEIQNKWKSYVSPRPYISSNVHPDVYDNNSIPGGP